jgi:dTDP-4-amino-4,6-dideoxygalactose transaminase
MSQPKVRFFDYPVQFAAYKKEYMSIIEDVLTRGAYILGEDVERFERELADYVGVKYAVGVGNCTDALLLSLLAAGIGAGDEVITSSHTFVATVEVIKFAGAVPVFADLADDHTMSAASFKAAITPRTKAVMPVQINGRICQDMDEILKIAGDKGIIVIEDSAQALGAKYDGKSAGAFGLSGNFSFYPAKLLGTFGDAGAVVTNDKTIADKVKMMRNHGRGEGTDINMWGLNCRIDNLHAAILSFKLKKLPAWIERRRAIASAYQKGLGGIKSVKTPPPPEQVVRYDVYQNYEIEAERRDELKTYLADAGIETAAQWGGKPVHQFRALGLSAARLPVTDALFKKCLLLPLYPELSDEQVNYVIERIKEFYRD